MTLFDSHGNSDEEEEQENVKEKEERKTPPISRTIDQTLLCQCLRLSSSYLITDASMNPERGTHTWGVGLSRLIDIVIALHNRSELELATVVAATKACRECWIAAGAFTAVEECRGKVRQHATKLRDSVMDSGGKTYKGARPVYTPFPCLRSSIRLPGQPV
jgi:hypothetical protein